ncbi:hypothetical protein COCON_G00188100 [Conger conger]|uniref:Uncharacterized protein n=1 Tax=Conger conger TaxID=82655 RepID=A0A9Q1D3S0_CONCO|nr:hypothetical protein COCON_G00188100 [Conger conger]
MKRSRPASAPPGRRGRRRSEPQKPGEDPQPGEGSAPTFPTEGSSPGRREAQGTLLRVKGTIGCALARCVVRNKRWAPTANVF